MYKTKIDAYIDSKKDEMLRDLEALVRIDSQRGPAQEGCPFGEGPAAALEEAMKLMSRYGLKVRNYENYVVTGDLSSQPKGLDILAHLDVVPVTKDWTVTEPFEPKVVDGRIYGRGTADDKGPAIAALYALRALKELGIPLKKNVRLVLGSDEECGSGDLKYYYGIEEEAPFTFTPDADFPVINIEKGRLAAEFYAGDFKEDWQLPAVVTLKSGDKANVVPGRALMTVSGLDEETVRKAAQETEKETGVTFTVSGRLVAEAGGKQPSEITEIEARGQAAHASTPQEGKNALTAMLRLAGRLPLADTKAARTLRALDRLFPYEDTCGRALGIDREDPDSGALTLCLSILDVSSGGLRGVFDARLPIGCTEENTRLPLAEKLKENGIKLEDKPMTEPHCVPGDSEFVKTLLKSYETYTGIQGKPLSTGGGTYVHHLKRGVAFGCMSPEVDNHMHGDDEFMVIDTLLMSAKIFADAVIRICS